MNGYKSDAGNGEPPGRLGSLARAGLYKLGEGVTGLVPRSTGKDILSLLYNTTLNASEGSFNGQKHVHGTNALKNDIPYLKKVFQNGWSLAHLPDGVTEIEALYTARDPTSGVETPIYLQSRKENPVETGKLEKLIDGVLKGEGGRIKSNYVDSKLDRPEMRNDQAIEAKVYHELTDEDVGEVVDPGKLIQLYGPDELQLTGQQGKRSTVGTYKGLEIVKYDRPSKMDILGHRLKEDILYTLVTTIYAPLERFVGKDRVRRQKAGMEEVIYSIHGSQSKGKRSDGYENPIKMSKTA